MIKKGTKIKYWWCTHDRESYEECIEILDEDCTEGQLDNIAHDLMWINKEPEWGWEEIK